MDIKIVEKYLPLVVLLLVGSTVYLFGMGSLNAATINEVNAELKGVEAQVNYIYDYVRDIDKAN